MADLSPRDISIRYAGSLLCAFVLFTAVWILWGIFTPGDFFGNGNGLVLPSLAIGTLTGLITGFRAGGRWRVLVFAVAFASLCFWILAPDGWWAHELP